MEYQFNRDYFYPKGEDGNLSLVTQELRIKDALQLLEGKDDYLLIDGSIKCYNEEQLRAQLNG